MLEAVIFDMDGVILDSEPVHFGVEREMLERFGVEFQFEEHTGFVGQTTLDLWNALCAKYGIPEDPVALAREDNENYQSTLINTEIQPIPGVRELITELDRRYVKMVVASSAVRKNIDIVLNKFLLKEYFQGYVSGQDVFKTKPDPEIFLRASAMVGASPEKCVVIEDAAHGVHAAKNAGMTCIAYRNENSGRQDLTAADHIVESLSEINLNLIEGLLDRHINA